LRISAAEMRVVLIGSVRGRARLRDQLRDTSIQIVGEAPTLSAARAGDADAFLVANDTVRDTDYTVTETDSPARDTDYTAEDTDYPGKTDFTDKTEDADYADYTEPLTRREIEVLDLLAEGLPNKAIAARLGISDQTVKFHVSSICGKLGAANRTDAVRRAVRRGIINL
jgi:DNA-binding NarL/FixJ family response regulator